MATKFKSNIPGVPNAGAGASRTEKTHNAEFGKGGRGKDVPEQNADTAAPGRVGKVNMTKGPGAKFTTGKGRMQPFTPAAPAAPGVTAPRPRQSRDKSQTELMRNTKWFNR